MSQTNLTKSTRVQRELSEQLITMFGFNHPQILSIHLDRMFLAWNASDEADVQDMRKTMMHSMQMMKDFFFIFAKEDPVTVATALKNLSNQKTQSHEA